MPDDLNWKLLLYLRQHGHRYSLDALRRQLSAEGYAEPEIAAAIQVWEAEKPPAGPSVWKPALLIALGNLVLAVATALIVAADAGRTGTAAPGVILPLALGTELIGGLILVFVPEHRWLGRALLLGLGLFLGLVVLTVGSFCLFVLKGLSH